VAAAAAGGAGAAQQELGDGVLAAELLKQHLGGAGLGEAAVNCLPLSVSTSLGTS
jgi:hypothetical protein